MTTPMGGVRAKRRARHVSAVGAAAQTNTLLRALADDDTPHALRPHDPSLLRSLVEQVMRAVDDQVPTSTLAKDDAHWAYWKEFCRALGTDPDRPAATQLSDAQLSRESFMQAAFVIWIHPRLKPRRSRPLAKPDSARACLSSVRRVHKRRGVVMAPAPLVNLALRGLIRRYIREHGIEALLPNRKEAITNEHATKILGIRDGTIVNGITVRWSEPRFICFRALLTCLRHMGARKADVLPVVPDEFDRSCMARSNIRYMIGGIVVSDPSPAELRGMRRGDLALVRPAASKPDQLGLTFGDKDIPLPFEPDDPLNGAAALVALELALPCHGAARLHTPAFTDTVDMAAMIAITFIATWYHQLRLASYLAPSPRYASSHYHALRTHRAFTHPPQTKTTTKRAQRFSNLWCL